MSISNFKSGAFNIYLWRSIESLVSEDIISLPTSNSHVTNSGVCVEVVIILEHTLLCP